MPRLRNITNPNPQIAEKVNYFIDRFQHFNLYAGSQKCFEIETPYSLVQKILFNLEEGKADRLDIFVPYFSHEIFKEKDLWDTLPIFQQIFPVFEEFLSGDKNKRRLIFDSSSLRKNLFVLLDELYHRSADILFSLIMRVILCPEPLAEHGHVEMIDFLSRLMVSEAYFTGKTMSDVGELVERIFLMEVYSFPFPLSVKLAERKKYLTQDNLRNQLSGFKAIMERQSKRGMVIKKAFSAIGFPLDMDFEYNGVRFLGKESLKIKKLAAKHSTNKYFQHFFADGDFIFVAAEVEYFSNVSVVLNFWEQTKDQLNFLSSMAGGSVELEPGKNFVVVSPTGKLLGWDVFVSPNRKTVSNYALKDFEHNNPYRLLSKTKGGAKEWMLQHEPIFIEAHRKRDVAGYWKYLEAVLPKNIKGEKQVRMLLSELLLINERQETRQRVLSTIRDSADFFSGGMELFGIPLGHIQSVQKTLWLGRIPSYVKKSTYPFVKELLAEFDHAPSSSELKTAKDYYLSILLEAYNVRNFDVHAGISNSCTKTKVRRSLPRLIVRLRSIIFDAILDSNGTSFPVLVGNLQKKSENLLIP